MPVVDVSWYRQADNNPFTIDGTVIDRNTFTRRSDLLPPTHNYIRNGNRAVAEATLIEPSQSVMYSLLRSGDQHYSLLADDVNMVRMGMTGVDRLAGTSDDYIIALISAYNCSTADIQVSLTDDFIPADSNGGCVADIDQSFPGNSLHYSVVSSSGQPKIFIELNPMAPWNFDVPLIYREGFENGEIGGWSDARLGDTE
jgi:hypothetical protein